MKRLLIALLAMSGRVLAQGQAFDPNAPYVGFCGKGDHPRQPNPDLSGRGTISVNLASVSHARPSLNGLLAGALPAKSGDPATPMGKIRPLRLGIWKGPQQFYRWAQRAHASFIYAMRSAWGKPLPKGGGWDHHRPGGPYAYPKEWAASVAKSAAQFSGGDVYMEIWNEPDCPENWDASPEKLFETYEIAYHALQKSVLGGPKLKMGGPGLNSYNRDYIRAFLDFAVSRRLKVNFISWHEISQTQDDIPSVAGRLKEARGAFLENLKYQSLGLKEIIIDENVGPKNTYLPGEILGQQFFLEQGGADKAARSGWQSLDRTFNVANGSLDGLIVPANKHHPRGAWFKPRSAWWAYKSYADTLSQRIPCRSSNPQVVCFAARPQRANAKIVLGYYGTQNNFPPVSLSLSVEDAEALAGKPGGRIKVIVQSLPDTGEEPLEKPPVIYRSQMAAPAGALTISLPSFAVHQGLLITLKGTEPKLGKRRPRRA